MIKSAFFVAIMGTALCAGISAVLSKFVFIPLPLIIQNIAMHVALFVVLVTIYRLAVKGTELGGMLMAAIVLRLLACLIYLIVLRVLSKSMFLPAALHFLAGFVVFTVLDIRFAIQLIKKAK